MHPATLTCQIADVMSIALGSTAALRDEWESTGFRLERLQCAIECVEEEQAGLSARQAPQWIVPFRPRWTPQELLASTSKAQVAVIRSACCSLNSQSGIASGHQYQALAFCV